MQCLIASATSVNGHSITTAVITSTEINRRVRMDGQSQSRLFGHASWTFQTEADLFLSTLVGLTSIRSGNDFKSTSVPCSGGSESSTAGTFVLFCFAPVLRNKSSRERKFQGAKVPGSESSTSGTFAPGSEWSWERKVQLPGLGRGLCPLPRKFLII